MKKKFKKIYVRLLTTTRTTVPAYINTLMEFRTSMEVVWDTELLVWLPLDMPFSMLNLKESSLPPQLQWDPTSLTFSHIGGM
jgi:hypothetical protein